MASAASGAENVYNRIREHTESLSKDPETVPNVRLFEEAELVLPDYLKGTQQLWEKRQTLMRSLAGDLTDWRQQDPLPAVNLLIKLFDGFSWHQVCEFGTQSVPFKDGLQVGDHMVAFNKLMIALLLKATTTAADVAHAAGMLEAMQALVRLWLCTSDTGVAIQASRLLLDLLRVDRQVQPLPEAQAPVGGQGLVWKRIFGDRDVYNVFFESTSLTGPCSDKMSKNQKTIAQARLMEWLPQVAAMNWNAVTRCQHPDIEARYGTKNGLLDFAILQMVDYKDDVLMYVCLVDFYSNLLHATRSLPVAAGTPTNSMGLAYLVANGIHARTIAIYLGPSELDPVESMFLYGPAANYIATYASRYPQHFLASQLPRQVTQRLSKALELTPARWAHAESPKHDLSLLASLPRKALLPFASSPASLLPSKSTNPDVLKTLATIFHGPEPKAIVYPRSSPLHLQNGDQSEIQEAAAACALYYNYMASNPRFWNDIVNHADTVALKNLALAAINCLTAVITANWSTSQDFALPTTLATPEQGHLAILAPPALEYTLPYLLKPAQTFANLVGGRGDSESAAYKIATAKYDALRALGHRVATQVEQQPGHGYEEILGTINKRMAEGPWSREGEVGGHIGTLEL